MAATMVPDATPAHAFGAACKPRCDLPTQTFHSTNTRRILSRYEPRGRPSPSLGAPLIPINLTSEPAAIIEQLSVDREQVAQKSYCHSPTSIEDCSENQA